MGDGYRKKVGGDIKAKEIKMPTPKMMLKQVQGGTISTIAGPSNAKKFVDIRTRIKKAGGYRDGGPVTSKRMTQEKLDRIRKDQIRRNPSDFDLETGARLTEKSKMDRKRRNQRKLKKMALGGEAATSVGRATVVKSQRDALRKEVDDMLDRVYGTGIKPKKKPKPPLKKKVKQIKPKKKPKKP